MKLTLLTALLLLLCGPLRAQTALSLYADDKAAPLRVQIASRTRLDTCRLERFTFQGGNRQRVPALLFTPLNASKTHPVPCLVALHGYGGGKETLAGWAVYAAGQGYATCAIDLWGQGERKRGGFVASAPPSGADAAALVSDMRIGIPQTVQDTRRALDYLQTRPDISKTRLGLLGFSLGAMVGTVAAASDTRLKTVVLVSGGGGWADILRRLARGERDDHFTNADWARLQTALAPFDPLSFAPFLAPRPVLMVNGRRDTTILPASAQRLFAVLHAAPGANVQIRWLANGGHIPDTDVVYPLIRAWLKGKL